MLRLPKHEICVHLFKHTGIKLTPPMIKDVEQVLISNAVISNHINRMPDMRYLKCMYTFAKNIARRNELVISPLIRGQVNRHTIEICLN
jgi:hypothetical protein